MEVAVAVGLGWKLFVQNVVDAQCLCMSFRQTKVGRFIFYKRRNLKKNETFTIISRLQVRNQLIQRSFYVLVIKYPWRNFPGKS